MRRHDENGEKGGRVLNDRAEFFTTVRKRSHVEWEEKRSLFLGDVMRTDTEAEAQQWIKQVKKQYGDATHHVYAYLMQGETVARYSDDGEPQGTAGVPVLDVIRKSGARNVCLVVTRYFGGTLLGAGGLVRAYSHTASLALEAAEIITYEPYTEYELCCGYSEYQKYHVILRDAAALIDDTEFEATVRIRFAVCKRRREELIKTILETGYGKDIPREVGERFDYQ